MAKLNPNKGMCILEPLEESEQKYGNIVIPNAGETKAMQARVVAMKDIYNFNLGVFVTSEFKVGDIVLYPALGATKQIVDRKEYIICGIQDILASIEIDE